MLKDFLLFIKYPYTAGIISVIWIGSAVLIGVEKELDVVKVMMIDLIATMIIAFIGFRGKKEF